LKLNKVVLSQWINKSFNMYMQVLLCVSFACMIVSVPMGDHSHHNMMHKPACSAPDDGKYQTCIKRKLQDATYDDNCASCHKMKVSDYHQPDTKIFEEFKCCLGDMKECIDSGKNVCGCMNTMMICNVITKTPASIGNWLGKMPIAIASIVQSNQPCFGTCLNDPSGNGASACSAANIALTTLTIQQMCTFDLAHSTHSTSAAAEIKWRKCIQPDTCTKPIDTTLIAPCMNLQPNQNLLQCIMDLKNTQLPTKHCREMICYDKFENTTPAPAFASIWTNCMTTL